MSFECLALQVGITGIFPIDPIKHHASFSFVSLGWVVHPHKWVRFGGLLTIVTTTAILIP
jgi:hypothetical protein